MRRKGIWVRSAFDLVFLVLGSVLIVADGFESALQQRRIVLPPAPGPQPKVLEDVATFVIGLLPTGAVLVDGAEHAFELANDLAEQARGRGDEEVVIFADHHSSIPDLYRLIAAMQGAGFRAVRFAVQEVSHR